MLDFAIAIDGLSKIGVWALDLLKMKSKKTDDAATALRKAVVETQIFLNEKIIKADEKMKDQAEIARHWSETSMKFRHLDGSLSDKCYKLSRLFALTKFFSANYSRKLVSIVEQIFEAGRHYKIIDML